MLEVSTFVWSSKFIFQDTCEGTSFLMQRLQVIIAVQKTQHQERLASLGVGPMPAGWLAES